MHGPVPTSSEKSRLERLISALAEPTTARADYWAAVGAVGLSLLLAWGLSGWSGIPQGHALILGAMVPALVTFAVVPFVGSSPLSVSK